LVARGTEELRARYGRHGMIKRGPSKVSLGQQTETEVQNRLAEVRHGHGGELVLPYHTAPTSSSAVEADKLIVQDVIELQGLVTRGQLRRPSGAGQVSSVATAAWTVG